MMRLRETVDRILYIPSTDHLEARRRKLLNIIVFGLSVALLFFFALLATMSIIAPTPGYDYVGVFVRSFILLVFHIGVYFLNRRASGRVASAVYLIGSMIWLVGALDPVQYLTGIMILIFGIPIIASSFILHRTSSFFVAFSALVAFIIVGYYNGISINPSLIGGLLSIALISWLSASSLEKALNDMKKTEFKFTTLYDSMLDGYGRSDLDGNMIEWNDALRKMVEFSDEEMSTSNFREFTPEKWRPIESKILEEQVLVRGYSDIYEKEYQRRDGSVFPVELRVYLTRTESGDPWSFWRIIRDITQRKAIEEEIRVLNDHLEVKVEERTKELKEAQDQLLNQARLTTLGKLSGGIGHELRNPLAAMKNSVYLLRMILTDNEDLDLKESLDILDFELATSEMIINSLLDYAKPKPPTLKKVKINELIQNALSRIQVPENVELFTDLQTDLPILLVDPIQLNRVMINLTRNAVQAMQESGELRIVTRVDKPGWLSIVVSDTGKGISPENLVRLFEPLFTTKAKGIGLGLAISKSFVEAHNGSIEVESQIDIGTTISVRLPLPSMNGVTSSENKPDGRFSE
ncbi:MAG: ATP-binding protein [Candidatus Thorarchaeota archaeon]